jgi:hypothetical protein
MATIPNAQKILTSSADVDTTYGGPASLKEMNTWYTMQDIIDTVGGPAPVLTTYPVTNAALAGKRFWYKGNEWHYMTQAEIDSTGWTGLVSVGFPAPVSKVFDLFILVSNGLLYTQTDTVPDKVGLSGFPLYNTEYDFIGLGIPNRYALLRSYVAPNTTVITKFRNANLLTSLEDFGTRPCFNFSVLGLTTNTINDLFNQLPTTTKTATINVVNNPGSATCDPTIATAKGYTVVTT